MLRRRWKFIALLSLLTLGVTGFCLFIGKAQQRKDYVGSIDPRSGTRCRFTLAPGWTLQEDTIHLLALTQGQADFRGFDCTPSPVRKWIDRSLLHRPVSNVPRINLYRWDEPHMRQDVRLVDGYPEPSINKRIRVVIQRRLKIDGYPATVATLQVNAGRSFQGIFLTVYIPDHSTLYQVSYLTETGHTAQSEREIQAIIPSFHIEKVARPIDNKQ